MQHNLLFHYVTSVVKPCELGVLFLFFIYFVVKYGLRKNIAFFASPFVAAKQCLNLKCIFFFGGGVCKDSFLFIEHGSVLHIVLNPLYLLFHIIHFISEDNNMSTTLPVLSSWLERKTQNHLLLFSGCPLLCTIHKCGLLFEHFYLKNFSLIKAHCYALLYCESLLN